MTSTRDVRDMLGFDTTQDGPRPPAPKKKKKQGPPMPRMKGMSREVQMLQADRPTSVAIAEPQQQFKKKLKRQNTDNVRWRVGPFGMSSRDDGAVFRHWKKDILDALPKDQQRDEQENETPIATAQEGDAMEVDVTDQDLPKNVLQSKRRAMAKMMENTNKRNQKPESTHPDDVEDSKFSKYNKTAPAPSYDDAIYDAHLKDASWSKEETDHLMQLHRDYHGRFHLICDRWSYTPPDPTPTPSTRTVEDLKARFYSVSAAVMTAQTPLSKMNPQEFKRHELLTQFDPAQERKRKEYMARFLTRPKAEREEERILLLELKKIYDRRLQTEAEGRELRAKLDTSLTKDEDNAISYTTSSEINALLQKMFAVDKERRAANARRMQLSGAGGMGMASSPVGTRDSQSQQQGGRDKRASLVSGPTPARQGMTPAQEAKFGVKTFERLPGGVTFKSDKLTKARQAKSQAKTERIATILGELGIPDIVHLPTDEVCKGMEGLVGKILELYEKRRIVEKEEGELKVEREKARLDAADANGEGASGQPAEPQQPEKLQYPKDEDDEDENEDNDVSMADADAEGDAEGDEEDYNEADDAEADAAADEEGDEEDDVADQEDDHLDDDGDGEETKVEDEDPAPSLPPPNRGASRKRRVSVLSAASGASRGSRAASKRRKG